MCSSDLLTLQRETQVCLNIIYQADAIKILRVNFIAYKFQGVGSARNFCLLRLVCGKCERFELKRQRYVRAFATRRNEILNRWL